MSQKPKRYKGTVTPEKPQERELTTVKRPRKAKEERDDRKHT